MAFSPVAVILRAHIFNSDALKLLCRATRLDEGKVLGDYTLILQGSLRRGLERITIEQIQAWCGSKSEAQARKFADALADDLVGLLKKDRKAYIVVGNKEEIKRLKSLRKNAKVGGKKTREKHKSHKPQQKQGQDARPNGPPSGLPNGLPSEGQEGAKGQAIWEPYDSCSSSALAKTKTSSALPCSFARTCAHAHDGAREGADSDPQASPAGSDSDSGRDAPACLVALSELVDKAKGKNGRLEGGPGLASESGESAEGQPPVEPVAPESRNQVEADPELIRMNEKLLQRRREVAAKERDPWSQAGSA